MYPSRPRINALERRIKDVEQFDPTTVRKRFTDPNVQALETAIDETLSDIFGKDTDDYMRYRQAADFDNGPLSWSTNVVHLDFLATRLVA